jgi:hypothetical protein
MNGHMVASLPAVATTSNDTERAVRWCRRTAATGSTKPQQPLNNGIKPAARPASTPSKPFGSATEPQPPAAPSRNNRSPTALSWRLDHRRHSRPFGGAAETAATNRIKPQQRLDHGIEPAVRSAAMRAAARGRSRTVASA